MDTAVAQRARSPGVLGPSQERVADKGPRGSVDRPAGGPMIAPTPLQDLMSSRFSTPNRRCRFRFPSENTRYCAACVGVGRRTPDRVGSSFSSTGRDASSASACCSASRSAPSSARVCASRGSRAAHERTDGTPVPGLVRPLREPGNLAVLGQTGVDRASSAGTPGQPTAHPPAPAPSLEPGTRRIPGHHGGCGAVRCHDGFGLFAGFTDYFPPTETEPEDPSTQPLEVVAAPDRCLLNVPETAPGTHEVVS
jgi:hypothetical protein